MGINMADRKVYVDVSVRLIVRVDSDADVNECLNEMEYDFNDTTGKMNIEDTEIIDFDITDSK